MNNITDIMGPPLIFFLIIILIITGIILAVDNFDIIWNFISNLF